MILQIPHDMHEWDDETRRQWLALVATHPDVTPRMLRIARAAVARANSGQPPPASDPPERMTMPPNTSAPTHTYGAPWLPITSTGHPVSTPSTTPSTPKDTPMTTPPHHLSDAADAVREFNHTSRPTGPDWQYPAHSYDALGSLSYLVGMLEQAVRQSISPVLDTFEAGRIRIDGGGLADPHVRELVAARDDAMKAAAALTAAVQRMHNATSPMGLDTAGIPEFEDDEDDNR
ncbi:hypothetical protein [Streptomyces noursei]|uniref:hypothetical protein n=1 Tax=Streptomyces noursei TaxID=1971 RepID=UPI001F448806|nr:hypothetical protein [Streptomyces noursei]